jgi:hypothetical protein
VLAERSCLDSVDEHPGEHVEKVICTARTDVVRLDQHDDKLTAGAQLHGTLG